MWVKIFIDYLRYERGCSEHTVTGYQAALEEFRRFYENLSGELDWAEIDSDIVRDWMLEKMDNGSSVGTVSLKLSALRSFYRFLLQRKFVDRDPVHNIRGPKRAKTLPSYVKDVEMERLLDGEVVFPDSYVGERDRLILLTFYSTGIRASELVGLDVSDVDLDRMQLKVTGKRNKQRVIPYGDEMGDAIRSYMEAREEFCVLRNNRQEAFFLSEGTASRIKYEKVRTIVNHYLSQVTSQHKRSPHVLRHTFATSMLNHRADLQTVKELLGHEKLSTTEIYTHTSFEELKHMYNQAHPRAK